MDYGIDVSHYQTVTNWQAVAGNNIEFCSIKLSEGWTWSDGEAWHHIDGCDAAGIAPGGYHFARPGDVAAQVEHFSGLLKHHRLLLPGRMWPMLDMEDHNIGDPNWFVAEFVRLLRQHTGIPGVLVYASVSWWNTTLDPSLWSDDNVLLWAAHYNGDPGNPAWAHPKLALHQHTNQGSVPGIVGHVDRNATVGGYVTSAFTIGDNPPAPAPPAPEPAPPVPAPPESPRSYTVQPGDTLSELAVQFGTTVEALQHANGLGDPDVIYVGQQLTIPDGENAGPATYVVQPGDTLSGIAAQLGVDMGWLAEHNRIDNPNLIYPGQVLRY